jgi:formamidopyrimidine-DNA glycosylase
MPELPEVETIKRYLEKDLIRRKIKDVRILNK